ncbi:MAG TPA: TerC family protein [Anaerolineaceae bacterium]
MEFLTDPQSWIALLTLSALEIVLGIDNIVFISILAGKLPGKQAVTARQLGIGAALVTRVLLLFSISWIVRLTQPLFTIAGWNASGRDLILIAGGLFLLAKSTFEIHERLEGEEDHGREVRAPSLAAVVAQIALLDIIFSLDSVITAVGMSNQLVIMIAAVLIAMLIMLLASGTIMDFVNRHPTVKMLALSFLLLIGFSLVVEGIGVHIPKGYIYFAMGFSVLVEFLNLRARRKTSPPVELRTPYVHRKMQDSA